MRKFPPSRVVATASAGENVGDRATSRDVDPIVIGDHDAARRWLVKVIAARAVTLYRERHKRLEKQANDRDDDHGDDQEAGREREKRAG